MIWTVGSGRVWWTVFEEGLLPSRFHSLSVTSQMSQLPFPSAVCSWRGRAVLRKGAWAAAFPLQPHTVDGAAGWLSPCSVGTEAEAQPWWATESRAVPQHTWYCLMPDTHHDAIHSKCDLISFTTGISLDYFSLHLEFFFLTCLKWACNLMWSA